MRIPTISQFKTQLSSIAKQFESVQHLQEQAASGKKIQRASENPLLAQQIKSVQNHLGQLKGFQLNCTLAETRTELCSNKIQESINLVNQAQECLQKAQNDTLSNQDRVILAGEMQNLLDNILNIANTKDSQGESIFAGFNVKQNAFAFDGSKYSYQGSPARSDIPLSGHLKIPYTEVGSQIFGNIAEGNGHYALSANSANQGTGLINFGSISNKSGQTSPEAYEISIVKNAAGLNAVQIFGSQSGQIVPQPPKFSPDDAPLLVPGQEIKFNGMSLVLSGKAEPGDIFYAQPSQATSIFDALQASMKLLKTPIHTDSEQAQMHQGLVQQMASLEQISNHLLSELGQLGNRAQSIDDEMNMNKNTILDEQIILSKLTDVDIAQVISELTKRLTSLEVTQQSFLKVQETFYKLLNR